jgi:hypothetical protein
MANMNDLYEALRRADAAGDTDGARKLAEYIRSLQTPAPQPASKERTYGEGLQDFGGAAIRGIGSLVQVPGQVYGLITGDMRRTGVLGLGKDIEEYGETLKSPGLVAREQARQQAIKEATAKEGQFGAFKSAFSETVKDPALLLTFLAEQAPQLLVPFGAAKIAKGVTAAKGAEAAAQAGVRGAIGAAGVQQGADVGAGAYENIYAELKSKGASDKEAAEGALNLARAAGASGAIISVLAQRLPGARALEETFAGVPGTAGRAARVGRGALGESAGEITEEVGGRFGQNLAMREVKPEQSLTEGLGETAGMAAIGGGLLGGVAGLARRPQPPEAPVIEPPPPTPITSPEQQRIEQTTGVERPSAVGIEGLLSAEEAERQRIAMMREKADEAARQQAERTRTEGITGETTFPVSVPETPRFEPEPVTKTQEELAVQQAEVDRRRQEAGLPTAEQQKAGITTVEKPLIAKTSPVPKLVDPRPLTEQQANARLGVLKNMLSIEGGDPNSLGIVPHPSASGKFAIKSFDLPFKLSPEVQATAFGTPEKPVVIDPVEAYVNIARQTNTPAAKRFVKDWKAGRIPREDVERALQTERQLLSLPPLTFLGSPEAKIAQQQVPGPTVQGVRDISDKPIRNVGLVAEGPASTFPPAKFETKTWNVPAGQVEPTSNIELPALQFVNNTSFDPVDYYIRMLTDQTNVDPATLTTNKEKTQYEKTKSFLDAYKQNRIPRTFIQNALKRQESTKSKVTEQPPKEEVVTPEPPKPPVKKPTSREDLEKILPTTRTKELERLHYAKDFAAIVKYFENHSNPVYKKVAELSKPYIKQIKILQPRKMRFAGVYYPTADEIQMDTRYASEERTTIHEMVHALVVRQQINPDAKSAKFVEQIKELRDYTRKELQKRGKLKDTATGKTWYAFDTRNDPQKRGYEFVTEAFSHPGFQFEIMQIPYTRSQSVWSKFVDLVANLLGIENKTVLSEVLSLVEQLAKTNRPNKRVSRSMVLSNQEDKQPFTKPPVIRIDPSKKNINQKFPELQEAAKQYGRGEITARDYAALVNSDKFLGEVREYDFVPAPATDADAQLALNKTQKLQWKKTQDIQPGTQVGLRLDINAYQNHGVWVNSIHPKDARVVYAAVSRITDAKFPNAGDKALRVATGETNKSPFARIEGKWSPISDEDAVTMMQDVFYDPAWTQVGYNPIRHSYFFDRATGEQVISADEVIQIGPLVLAKNAVVEEVTPQDGLVLYSEREDIEQETESFKEKLVKSAKQALQKRSPLKLAPQVSVEAAGKIQQLFAPENKTIIDKIENLKDRFWQRMAQGIADQFRSIKEYDEKAHMQARLSKSVDGGLEGLLFYGEVFNDDGALNIRKDGKGLIKALEPVGTEVDNFMIWMALNREEQLQLEGKIPSIPIELLVEKNNLSSGTLNGQSRLQVYTRVREDLNKLNRSVLNIARDTGLIDEKSYTRFSEDNFYVPFYKEMEGKDIDAPSTASGLTSQYFSKQLKGGERPFGDLVENTLRNWNHILSASMKNQAAVSTIQAASKFRLGDTPVVEPTTEKTGSAKIMVDGQAQYFKINDPLLFEAISAIGYLGPKSKFLDVARDFKNILQFGVTLSPAFKVNNLIRDSVSAMAVSELNKNPITNVLNGVSIFNKNDPTYISALAGGAIFNFGTAYEGDQSKLIKRLIEKGINRDTILDTPDRIRKGLRMAWDKYQEWGNAS